MSQRFQPAVAGPPQSPQQARYTQPMSQSSPGPVNNMRPYPGSSQNFPVINLRNNFYRLMLF